MKTNIISLLLVVSLIMSSCGEDFLNLKPEQYIASEEAITNANSLQAALSGTYNILQSYDYYSRSMLIIPDLMADNAYLSVKNSSRYVDFDIFLVQERDSYVEGLWNTIYEVVVNATRAIQGATEIIETQDQYPAKIEQLLGEAYTLRALAHFNLVQLFAQPYNYTADASHDGIPVIRSVSDDPISPPRESVNTVYNIIIDDLEQAVMYMHKETNNGYFSISAAEALLSRVYLYMEDYRNVISHASKVIEAGYSLVPNSEYVNGWGIDFNQESVFEIDNSVTDNAGPNSIGHFFDPAGYADALATDDVLNIYADTDIRKQLIRIGVKQGAEDPANFVEKYPDGANHTDNIRILRLAEVILNRSEAYANLNKTDSALIDLNLIVNRADPGETVSGVSDEALIERILLERRKELAFEGHRLFDLNRTKSDANIIHSDGIITATYPNDRFILPIPLSEIDSNNEINVNNPGY